jgi:hypothetical protein
MVPQGFWALAPDRAGTQSAPLLLEPEVNPNRIAEEAGMRVEYYVLFHDGGWVIKRQEQIYGPYSSLDEAVREAVYVANYSISRGIGAAVIVQSNRPQTIAFRSYLV